MSAALPQLTDWAYINQQVMDGRAYTLLAECEAAVSAAHPDAEALQVLAAALRKQGNYITGHPEVAFACLWNECHPYGGTMAEIASQWRAARKPTPWLRRLLPAPEPRHSMLRWSVAAPPNSQYKAVLSISSDQVTVWLRQFHRAAEVISFSLSEPLSFRLSTGQQVSTMAAYKPEADPHVWYAPRNSLLIGRSPKSWGDPIEIKHRETGQVVLQIPIDEDENISHLAASADGRIIVAGGTDIDHCGPVQVWDLQTVKLLMTGSMNHSVSAVAVSADGKRAAVGDYRGHLEVWNVSESQTHALISAHKDYINALAFSPDGQYLASCSHDGRISLWNLNGRLPPPEEPYHRDELLEMLFSPDGTRFVSRSFNNRLWLRDAETGRPIASLYFSRSCYLEGGPALRSLFIDDERILSIAGDDGGHWQTATGQPLQPAFKLRAHLSEEIVFSPTGELFAKWFGSSRLQSSSFLQVYKLGHGNSVCMPEDYGMTSVQPFVQLTAPDCRHAAFSGDGNFLAIASGTGVVEVWAVSDWSLAVRFTGHAAPVVTCALTVTGQLAASCDEADIILVWLVATGQTLLRIDASVCPDFEPVPDAPDESSNSQAWEDIAILPGGDIVATAANNLVRWSGHTGAWLLTIPWRAPITDYRDDTALLATFGDGSLLIRNITTNAELCRYPWSAPPGLTIPHPNGKAWLLANKSEEHYFVLEDAE